MHMCFCSTTFNENHTDRFFESFTTDQRTKADISRQRVGSFLGESSHPDLEGSLPGRVFNGSGNVFHARESSYPFCCYIGRPTISNSDFKKVSFCASCNVTPHYMPSASLFPLYDIPLQPPSQGAHIIQGKWLCFYALQNFPDSFSR